jgi:hypothetical protein
MKEKERPSQEASPSPTQPIAGSPEDLNKRVQNENPRANENIRQQQDNDAQGSAHDVGSEITNGEDG